MRTLLSGLAVAGLLLAVPTSATEYEIDSVHSSAIFKVTHLGVSNFYGAFSQMEGTVVYDPAAPESSTITIEIAAESVDTRNENRDGHVKSPDFLNAKQFPTIRFESTGVEATGEGRLAVTGDLTLLGVTRPVTAQVEKTGEGKHPRSGKDLVGFEARFAVDRTDYDMNFMAGPLGEEVEFILAIEAVKN